MERTPRLWWTAAVMTLLSGAAGGFFGMLSTFLYGGESADVTVGADLGAPSGIAVGVAWCWLMIRKGDAAQRRGAFGKLGRTPVLGGIAAGCTATVLLHLGMQLTYGFQDAVSKHLWGQAFGLVAGLLVGIVGAIAWPPVPKAAPEP